MATRRHTWFGAEKMFPGEELIRSGTARLRTESPPYWWEGELVLTTDRIIFLPFVSNKFLENAAFWLRDLVDYGPAGRNRLVLRSRGRSMLFQILGASPGALAGQKGAQWMRAIRGRMPVARPAVAFLPANETRKRAAG